MSLVFSYQEPVVHKSLPNDETLAKPSEVPIGPFEHAGAKVIHAEWSNRGIVRSRFPIAHLDPKNETVQRFLNRFHSYIDYMNQGKTEWEQILLIRDWLHRSIPRPAHNKTIQNLCTRPYPYGENPDPFEMLETAGSGLEWWCPHFSDMLCTLFNAAGFVSRKVGNVAPYVPKLGTLTHGVTDVFVNEIGKWVQMDAHFNIHYRKNGVPLSPAELGQEAFENQGEGVERVVGPNEEVKTSNVLSTLTGNHEAERAYWNRYNWGLDFFKNNGSWAPEMFLQYIQSRHKGLYCYQGRGDTCQIHSMYAKGIFHYTERKADVYPDMNTCRIEISNSETKPGAVRINIGTYTPNFDAVMVQVDDGIEQPRSLSFKWFLHTGKNKLKVRTRNKFGRYGQPSIVKVVLEKKD